MVSGNCDQSWRYVVNAVHAYFNLRWLGRMRLHFDAWAFRCSICIYQWNMIIYVRCCRYKLCRLAGHFACHRDCLNPSRLNLLLLQVPLLNRLSHHATARTKTRSSKHTDRKGLKQLRFSALSLSRPISKLQEACQYWCVWATWAPWVIWAGAASRGTEFGVVSVLKMSK